MRTSSKRKLENCFDRAFIRIYPNRALFGLDFSHQDISIFLNKERQYMESNGFKYFVWFMVIMSHGEQDGFFTSEDNKILFKNVLHQFDGHNCKGLLFVPKVFIFQCCRGGETH